MVITMCILSRAFIRHSIRLLDMEYKPDELAEELGAANDLIIRMIAAGAPAWKDAKGHYWIHGLSFAKWLNDAAPKKDGDNQVFPENKAISTPCRHGTINRENYQLARCYMEYRDKVLQNDANTVQTYWQSLKHLLQWSDNHTFKDVQNVFPTFPEYLLTARNERHPNDKINKGKPLTPGYMKKSYPMRELFLNGRACTNTSILRPYPRHG